MLPSSRNQVVVLFIATTLFAIMIASSSVDGANIKHLEQEEEEEIPLQKARTAIAENKKFRIVYKILKAYLRDQIDQLDALTNEQDEESKILDSINVDRRQLKSQGIMERLKNKMDHDVSKYGWD